MLILALKFAKFAKWALGIGNWELGIGERSIYYLTSNSLTDVICRFFTTNYQTLFSFCPSAFSYPHAH
jgi:hypothetical protein